MGLSVVISSSSIVLAAEPSSLADLTRPQFEFVDADKNGVITREEIQQTSKVYWLCVCVWGGGGFLSAGEVALDSPCDCSLIPLYN